MPWGKKKPVVRGDRAKKGLCRRGQLAEDRARRFSAGIPEKELLPLEKDRREKRKTIAREINERRSCKIGKRHSGDGGACCPAHLREMQEKRVSC